MSEDEMYLSNDDIDDGTKKVEPIEVDVDELRKEVENPPKPPTLPEQNVPDETPRVNPRSSEAIEVVPVVRGKEMTDEQARDIARANRAKNDAESGMNTKN